MFEDHELQGCPGESLKLDWEDCGDASAHTRITDLTPSTLSLGTQTTLVGTGDIDEGIADGATFDLEMTGLLGKLVLKRGMHLSRRLATCP